MISGKKGNWVDIFDYSIGALQLGVVILIVFVLIFSFDNQLDTAALSSDVVNDSVALGRSQSMVNTFPDSFDYVLPLIYVFFLGFSAWSARRIQSSHQFVFIAFFLLIAVFLFAMGIETGWQEFTSQASISPHIGSFPITNFFLSYLRFFVLFYGLIVGWALYAKTD